MTKILGKAVATAEQMSKYLLANNKNPKFSRDITALEFCQLFIDVCAKEDVRGDIAFAQSCKETGFFAYNGDVRYHQNNFAGIGATGGGEPGCVFETIEIGILAQAQHLKSYATKDDLNEPCVDPRRTKWFMNMKGGTAPHIEQLGGTWAVPGYAVRKYSSLEEANAAKDSYGYQIMNMVDKILKIEVEQPKVETPVVEETKKEETIMVAKNGILLAVDAGHGSNTAGKRTPDGYREHWINVKCANYFDIAVKRCGFDTFKVAWNDTDATDDSDIALSTRQTLIKNAKCKGSVSWHANAHGDGTTYTSGQGVETLYHNDAAKAKNSKALAELVQAELIKGTAQKNRGAKPQSLAMCNCPAMGTTEAILIEVGFMTNEYEKNLLKTDAFCLECAEEAARGVCKYYGVTYIAPGTTTVTETVKPVTTKTTNYTVKSGDTLSKIGKANNIDWKVIAELNGIKSPYHLSVGQVIKLPVAETEATKEEVKVPNKVTQSKADIQTFLNKYYGDEIKAVLGAKLTVNGVADNNTKRAIGIAFQVEMNKLGAGLAVDGKIGPASEKAFTKFVGTLKSGSTGIFVTLWQCLLVCYNLDPKGIDGKFGNGCTAATNTMLTKVGLTKDSDVSGADLNAIL